MYGRALHKAFTTPRRRDVYIHRQTAPERRGRGRGRGQGDRGAWRSVLKEHGGTYKVYLCWLQPYVPRPRSLEVACCALICALTVCEHSMASISTLCGISHRSLHSSRISVRPTIYTLCARACVCVSACAVKIISDLFALAVEMQLAAVWGGIDLVCRSIFRQFLFLFFSD